jgi:hypothetical protein
LRLPIPPPRRAVLVYGILPYFSIFFAILDPFLSCCFRQLTTTQLNIFWHRFAREKKSIFFPFHSPQRAHRLRCLLSPIGIHLSKPDLKIGHFHIARNRTYSCCVDNNFRVLNFNPSSGLSFFRRRRRYSHAHGEMIIDNMEKEITIPYEYRSGPPG